ncbi:tRNA (guanosine(37)-N1)-methyltransferase TrmD [Jannaschia sp. LMIT008]|uniref:tRNA (guanosine(37)-N1)-methyltransferase TrmD n=1 Tax=Jannaschia maritima TaxID=3032585 RepID=UPI002811DDD7|nr:tRNA (guanosine(37)-N1)-methyltransferase TrmD [Jannaschia sp. LMIT008]
MSGPARSHGTRSIRASTTPRDLLDEPARTAWQARVVTLFPDAFPGVLDLSLTGQARRAGLWHLSVTDLRAHGLGRHRQVDAPPAGGGAGLVLRPDVVGPALDAARGPGPVLYLSPRGRPFDQATARTLAAGPGATLLCGRFEGVDQRVLDDHDVTEISVGDYVLTGGELAAQIVLDATIRLLPGVLGNPDSIRDESHSEGLLEHPHYTKPAEWRGQAVPPVLTSGDHARVAEWRRAQAHALTRDRRPDLWARHLARKGDRD